VQGVIAISTVTLVHRIKRKWTVVEASEHQLHWGAPTR
jgi:hypothetical protein